MHTSLKQTIAQFQTMVSSWATTGSSPFIHTHLYKAHLPRCVGDAFTSLAAYVMITQSQSPSPKHDSTAEDTVLRIIASKIETIILDEDTNLKEKEIPTFSHIARVHALLVLVAIGLFDGDIRLRHTAERHLATLGRWNGEMLDAARRAAWSGELLLGGAAACFDGERRDGEGMPCGTATKKSGVEALWQAFVLSETVRRTWLVCTGVRGAYRLPQDGQLHRAGGLMFTTAQGIWDAPSAWTWAKLCAEKDVGFMEHAQTKRLFGERRPDEVDTFGKLMLVATWGAERMEIWGGHLNC
ncbi:hypothetical protein QBC34DRAFT_417967 [Podospora aff. communis PSN243]|uniref:Transcription factor domain-containing protein n=1 Tax=Podospora aff. communis PSN243 TaxID=3040156 RepID=A0AAV9G6F8_9PEZI|nr:hypothetical protein QBC34DRAFT_417967 [Podospora aff. communis PSN243]